MSISKPRHFSLSANKAERFFRASSSLSNFTTGIFSSDFFLAVFLFIGVEFPPLYVGGLSRGEFKIFAPITKTVKKSAPFIERLLASAMIESKSP